ncbi:MAG: Tfp pilus assembly protein FimT/FimU [Chthoniobacterales bacterium]
MRRNERAFTMIEMAIAVFIMLLLMGLAIPSLNGVLKDRRLRRSLDDMNKLVRSAQERSVSERRPYLISWQKDRVILRPESFARDEAKQPTTTLTLRKGDAYLLKLPLALIDDPPADWIFWSSGTCEPAIVSYKGADGSWSAKYSALTARAEMIQYAAR